MAQEGDDKIPYMKNGKRNYQAELAWEKRTTGKGRQDDRVERNRARAHMMERGKVRKGDGKDVDHRRALSKGGSGSASNLRVVAASTNRSFARNKDGSMKNERSKKEKRR